MAEELSDKRIKVTQLAQDEEYYKRVFKRTERIVSVIFYILGELKTDIKTETHIAVIKDRALATHAAALETLSLQPHEQSTGLFNFQCRLVALESTLRVAEAARLFTPETGALIYPELDAINRYLRHHYLTDDGIVVTTAEELLTDVSGQRPAARRSASAPASTGSASTPRPASTPRRATLRPGAIPAGDISSDAYLVYSQLTDRAERIKTVLEAKPEATIKDISEVITDVSEKTIQRELNSLIEKGQVIRQGERRWSRYSIAK